MSARVLDTNDGKLVKIFFPIESKEWHGFSSESMWAKKVEDNHYVIMNVPFYLKNIGLYDIVSTENENDGKLEFKSVIKRSGHSTYRIITNSAISENLFEKYWMPIEEKGCTYEKAKSNFYAIDVPPNSDIYQVYELLESGESNNVWEFEEGFCGHKLKKI